MNITPSMLYWLTRLDEINTALGIVFASVVAVVAVNIIGWLSALDTATDAKSKRRQEDEQEARAICDKRLKRAVRISLLAVVPIMVAITLVPSTKQAAAIIVIPKIANSEVVAEMGDTAKELVGLAKAWLVELKPQPKTENKEVK